MSTWYGDKQNGIEVRGEEDAVDEVLVYVGGECIVHMEGMSDQCYWFGIYTKDFEAHLNVRSKNLLSHVVATIEGMQTPNRKKPQHPAEPEKSSPPSPTQGEERVWRGRGWIRVYDGKTLWFKFAGETDWEPSIVGMDRMKLDEELHGPERDAMLAEFRKAMK